MSVSLKHTKTSAKADGGDTSLVQPSDWNAEHTLTLAAGKVLGRDTSGAGAVQELPIAIDTAGNIGLNSTPQTGRSVVIAKNITGSVGSYGALIGGTIQSDVTTAAYVVGTSASTAAASFTLGSLVHYSASQSTIGAGSTVTNQYGFFVSSNLVGATNNYGFYSNIPSGTGDYNFYAAGTADNYFAGNVTSGAVIADSIGNLRDLPQNAQTAAYTLVASDNGKHISITTGGVTVPSGVFAIGDTVTIFNNSTSSQTITQGATVTLRQAATTNTGNRTLAGYGICTILCVASNTFVITGNGLS